MEFTSIEQKILRLIRFFDRLDYALTWSQILKYLSGQNVPEDIYDALSSERLSRFISQKNGFYFLAGRDDLADKRLGNYEVGIKKIKRARRMASILRCFPWIVGVAVYGSLSLYNPRSEGDVDLFIVGTRGRLWSARFFVNIFMKIFGLRPTDQKKKNKICPSYWAAEDGLDLSLTYSGEADVFYRYYGASSFLFIYDAGGVANQFFLHNKWIKQDLPHWQPFDHGQTLGDNVFNKTIKQLSSAVLGAVSEKVYHAWQMKLLPERYKAIQNTDRRVIISDKIIKLHDNDKAESHNEEFKKSFDNFLEYAKKI